MSILTVKFWHINSSDSTKWWNVLPRRQLLPPGPLCIAAKDDIDPRGVLAVDLVLPRGSEDRDDPGCFDDPLLNAQADSEIILSVEASSSSTRTRVQF